MPEYLAIYTIGVYESLSENSPSHFVWRERVERFRAEDNQQATNFANEKIPKLRGWYDSRKYFNPDGQLYSLENLELELIVKVEDVIFECQKMTKEFALTFHQK